VLDTIRQQAVQQQERFDVIQGDWKAQLEWLKETSKQMTEYQEKLMRTLGGGFAYRNAPATVELTTGTPVWVDPGYDLRYVLNFEPNDLQFFGACVVQVVQVQHEPELVTVDYQASLHLDENYFLQRMLPQMNVLRTDPVYQLVHAEIKIPRAQLVQESIHMLNEVIANSKPREETVLISGGIYTARSGTSNPFFSAFKSFYHSGAWIFLLAATPLIVALLGLILGS